MRITLKALVLTAALPTAFLLLPPAEAADAAAEALVRKSNCFNCHALDKRKSAPSYKEIAAKYKEDHKAQEKLFTHLTTNPLVEVDGEQEEHASLKTRNDEDVRKVVRWILSL